MSQKISGVKGMNDLLPGELGGDMAPVETWQHVERVAREVFSRFARLAATAS